MAARPRDLFYLGIAPIGRGDFVLDSMPEAARSHSVSFVHLSNRSGVIVAIRHIFLWSVLDGVDGEEVLRKLAALETEVPGLLGWSIGRHEGRSANSSGGKWQYGLTCDFESFDALDEYQAHPAYTVIVNDVEDTFEDWVVLEYLV